LRAKNCECRRLVLVFTCRAEASARRLVLDFLVIAVGPGFNADRVAAQKDLRSNLPCRQFPGLGLEPL